MGESTRLRGSGDESYSGVALGHLFQQRWISETVVSRHLRALNRQEDYRTPFEVYDEDLQELLSTSFNSVAHGC